jgi:hypothetical protein
MADKYVHDNPQDPVEERLAGLEEQALISLSIYPFSW